MNNIWLPEHIQRGGPFHVMVSGPSCPYTTGNASILCEIILTVEVDTRSKWAV